MKEARRGQTKTSAWQPSSTELSAERLLLVTAHQFEQPSVKDTASLFHFVTSNVVSKIVSVLFLPVIKQHRDTFCLHLRYRILLDKILVHFGGIIKLSLQVFVHQE